MEERRGRAGSHTSLDSGNAVAAAAHACPLESNEGKVLIVTWGRSARHLGAICLPILELRTQGVLPPGTEGGGRTRGVAAGSSHPRF